MSHWQKSRFHQVILVWLKSHKNGRTGQNPENRKWSNGSSSGIVWYRRSARRRCRRRCRCVRRREILDRSVSDLHRLFVGRRRRRQRRRFRIRKFCRQRRSPFGNGSGIHGRHSTGTRTQSRSSSRSWRRRSRGGISWLEELCVRALRREDDDQDGRHDDLQRQSCFVINQLSLFKYFYLYTKLFNYIRPGYWRAKINLDSASTFLVKRQPRGSNYPERASYFVLRACSGGC